MSTSRRVAVYAVLRTDLGGQDPELAVAVKEVVPTFEEAEAEVKRLNNLNADKHCRYIVRTTRYFSDGRQGHDDAE